MRRLFCGLLTACLGLGLLSGCDRNADGKVQSPGSGAAGATTGKPPAGKQSRSFTVRTESVETRPLKYEVEAVGTLVEENRYNIPARVAGVAESVSFSEGDVVTAGQELVRVDSARYRLLAEQARSLALEKEAAVRVAEASLADSVRETSSSLETAQLDLELAESEYRRRADLRPGAVITPEDKKVYETKYRRAQSTYRDAVSGGRTRVALAEAEVIEARAALMAARTALAVAVDNEEDSIVRAPVAGRIQQRSVTNGQFLNPGNEVAMMVQADPVRLRFTVPESKASALSRAMKIKFSVPALPTETFEAEVYDVGAIADPETREVQSWARVPNTEGKLRPGYFASVNIVTDSKSDSVVVPLGSVLPTEFGTVVYVVQDGMAVRKKVETGLQVTGDAIEIVSGLEPGEELVVEGMASLQDNVPVTVVGAQETQLPIRDQETTQGQTTKG